MKFEIKENTSSKVVIALQGELDTAASPKFLEDIQPVMKEAGKQILVDFSQLEYISSAGMRTLLLLNKNAVAQGGKLSIKGMREEIRQIFQLTGFDQMIEIL